MKSITVDFLNTIRNRPYLQDAAKHAIHRLKGIVVHWSAEAASANTRLHYYKEAYEEASVHYLVDHEGIYHIVPDNEIAMHTQRLDQQLPVGTAPGRAALSGNYFYLGVEVCMRPDMEWREVKHNLIELLAYLLRKHRLSQRKIFRGSGTTLEQSKVLFEEVAWLQLVSEVELAMQETPEGFAERARISGNEVPVYKGPGKDFPVAETLSDSALVAVFEHHEEWRRIGRNLWVQAGQLEAEKPQQMYFIKEATGATVRSGPGMHYPVVDALPCHSVVDALRRDGQWAAIGEQRWLHISTLGAVHIDQGVVFGTQFLNVRSGPDTTNPIIFQLKQGEKVNIWEEHSGWLRIGDDEWVFGSFVGSK